MPATGAASLKPSAKAHLPSDLQLYFTRLTTSLIPPTNISPNLPAPPVDPNSDTHALPESERHRLAALASLRSDAAVSGILVYLVKWVAESMSKCLAGGLGTLGCLVDVVEALLGNETIFIEPYVSANLRLSSGV
jgi:transcription initiation factor TFIID subunit 6